MPGSRIASIDNDRAHNVPIPAVDHRPASGLGLVTSLFFAVPNADRDVHIRGRGFLRAILG